MDLDTAMGFVGGSRNGVLVTLKSDGRPQLSNIIYHLGEDGIIRVSITDARAKTRNLRRDAAGVAARRERRLLVLRRD